MFRLFHRNKNRKGAEAIEFAFIFPLYFVVVMGIIEYGRGYQVAQWLTQAAREGGRLAMLYAVISQSDRDLGITDGNHKVTLDVQNFLKACGVEGTTVTIEGVDDAGNSTGYFDIDDYGTSAGEYFKVRVTVPYDNVKLITPILISPTTILSGEIVLRHE
jgi:Flp pilus assembly protein TadG